MIEISFEYWNKLADQIIVISSLLSGFSIAVISNFMISGINTKLSRNIMKVATLAACFFLVTVFAMTKLLMMTTEGYPLKIAEGDLILPRVIGVVSFLFGVISLIAMISLGGWTKSKSMGRFTTIVGIVTLILLLFFLT